MYQLSMDLDIIASVQTGPQTESVHCNSSGDATKLTDNINKVLLVDYMSRQLITCGSIKGRCSTRNLQNISLPEQNVVAAIVSSAES